MDLIKGWKSLAASYNDIVVARRGTLFGFKLTLALSGQTVNMLDRLKQDSKPCEISKPFVLA